MSKISELSDGGSLLPTDFLIAVRSGGNVKVQADQTEFDRIRLGDGEKIELGNSQDLQLYHSGSESVIHETGTGPLHIRSNSETFIQNGGGTETLAHFGNNGAVTLYHDNSPRIATSSSGATISGSVTADGGTGTATSGGTLIVKQKGDTNADGIALTSSHSVSHRVWKDAGGNLNIGSSSYPSAFVQDFTGNVDIAGTATINGLTVDLADNAGVLLKSPNDSSTAFLKFGDTTSSDSGSISYDHFSDSLRFKTINTNRMILASNGDVSLYEDTGTTAKLFWDASAESLGIGTANVLGQLHINAETAVPTKVYVDGETNQPKSIEIRHYDTSEQSGAGRNLFYLKTPASGRLDIGNFSDGTSETQLMTFLESGSVGIGTSSPIAPLHVKGTTNGNLLVRAGSLAVGTLTGTALSSVNDAVSATTPLTLEGSEFNFVQSNAVKVKVDSSGNVGINDTSPTNGNLTIRGASTTGTKNGHIMLTGDSATVGQGPQIAFSESGISSNWVGATIGFTRTGGSGVGDLLFSTRQSAGDADTTATEVMRLTSAGNFLVDNTVANPASGYASQKGFGYEGSTGKTEIATTADAPAMQIGKNHANDGDIVVFRKQANTIGSLGVNFTDNLYIGGNTSHSGLMFSADEIYPYRNGTYRNNEIDLGAAAGAFRHAYIQSGIYLGGTAAANKLDDVEHGTWSPTFLAVTTNPTVSGALTTGYYSKVGRMVTASWYSTGFTVSNAGSGSAQIGGLPFPVTNQSNSYTVVNFTHTTGFANEINNGYVGPNGTTISPITSYATSGTTWNPNTSGTHYIMLTITYQTDS